MSDFVFAKAIKPPYRKVCTQTVLSQRVTERDAMLEPHYNQRLRFVVAAAEPHVLHRNKCVTIEEYIESGGRIMIDFNYYIKAHIIKSLTRVLGTQNSEFNEINLTHWYENMKKPKQALNLASSASAVASLASERGGKGTLTLEYVSLCIASSFR